MCVTEPPPSERTVVGPQGPGAWQGRAAVGCHHQAGAGSLSPSGKGCQARLGEKRDSPEHLLAGSSCRDNIFFLWLKAGATILLILVRTLAA